MSRITLPRGITVHVAGTPVTLVEHTTATSSLPNTRRIEQHLKGMEYGSDDGDENEPEKAESTRRADSEQRLVGDSQPPPMPPGHPAHLQAILQVRRRELQEADADAQRLLRLTVEDPDLFAIIRRSIVRGWL